MLSHALAGGTHPNLGLRVVRRYDGGGTSARVWIPKPLRMRSALPGISRPALMECTVFRPEHQVCRGWRSGLRRHHGRPARTKRHGRYPYGVRRRGSVSSNPTAAMTNLDKLCAGLGRTILSRLPIVNLYPTVRHSQPALNRARTARGITLLAPWTSPRCAWRPTMSRTGWPAASMSPKSMSDAKFSLPYCTAVALY